MVRPGHAAMIAGQVVGQGVAATAAGARVPFVMVEPANTLANLGEIGRESQRWHKTALRYVGATSTDVAKRAQFADEVLALTGEQVRLGVSGFLIAQATDGRILGVTTYGSLNAREGTLNLVAIDPEHLAGSPGTAQLRGIGTSMVAAASQLMLARGVEVIYLHPFDQEAALFWSHRGFGYCGAGGLLCVRGRAAVEALRGRCELAPDCGDRNDCVVCGRLEDTARVRVPALRATM